MGREDLVAVASRIFAVFLLVTIARSFPSAIQLLGQEGSQPPLVLAGLVLASSIIVCALLWFFPLTIARKLLPVMHEPRSETAMSGSVALSVGLTLLGMWVVAQALPDALYWTTLFFLTRQAGAAYFEWGYEQIAGIVSTVAELALAAWLIFGSSGIKRLVLRYRHGPVEDVA
jgi:divalent metal cation (Fe/Co/Zn/Cd) transporter